MVKTVSHWHVPQNWKATKKPLETLPIQDPTERMLVSNDFAMRMVGSLIPLVPGDKSLVFDNNFESVIRKLGRHQVFIDISRCRNLTTLPFGSFNVCSSLLYLDISYTKLNDLKALTDHCSNLRGLNISGLELMDRTYSRVAYFGSLEILTMRNTNALNVDWIELLPMLRSLDLGMNVTKTDPIWHVRNLSRLEELVLDCSAFPVELEDGESTPTYANLDAFESLPALKLLNISETGLARFAPQISEKVGRLIQLEATSRRWLMFAAVAGNDFRTVHRLLTSGHDLDSRVTPSDEVHMARLWRTRCVTAKQRAPYFLCSAADESHRPNALHFAIYFNARECVELLLDAGADETLSVWFSDVREADGVLSENTSLSTKQPRKVLNCRQLLEAVFHRNVHRITADLIAKKVAGWKALTTTWYKRLLYVFRTPRGSLRLTAEEIDRKMASVWVDTTPGEPDDAAVLAAISEGPESVKKLPPASKLAAQQATGFPDDTSAAGLASTRSGTSPSRRPRTAPGEIADSDKDVDDATVADGGSGEDKETEDGSREEEGGGTDGVSSKDPGLKQDKIVPQMRRHFTWRDHALVEKAVGSPIVLEIKVPVTEPPPSAAAEGPPKALNARSRLSIRGGVTPSTKPAAARESARFGASTAGTSSTWGSSMVTGKTTSMAASEKKWLEEAAAQRFETVQLPMLGKKSFWLESRALVLKEREDAYQRSLLPEVGRHRLDAVERALLGAAKFKPGKATAAATSTGASAANTLQEEDLDEADEESESVHTSGDVTPGFVSGMESPTFMMSPPGTAQSQRPASTRESPARPGVSSRAGYLPAVDERGGVTQPTAALASASVSVKQSARLSSSERRERFLVQLSQRMEERLNATDEEG